MHMVVRNPADRVGLGLLPYLPGEWDSTDCIGPSPARPITICVPLCIPSDNEWVNRSIKTGLSGSLWEKPSEDEGREVAGTVKSCGVAYCCPSRAGFQPDGAGRPPRRGRRAGRQISYFEVGQRQPSLDQLLRIARTLGSPVQKLLTGADGPGIELRDLVLELRSLGLVDLWVNSPIVPVHSAVLRR